MRRIELSLQRKLFAWLLGPLCLLLVLDSYLSYSSALNFSNQAYDRALQEVANEVFLHLKTIDGQAQLDISPSVERLLIVDQDDRRHYKVVSSSGRLLGGDALIPLPAKPLGQASPAFYDDMLQGEPVRVLAVHMGLGQDSNADRVLVQVAETLNKRNRLARDILASVVLPQLLLIVLASATVYFGIERGLAPLQPLRRAVSNRSHLDLSPIEIQYVPGEVRPLVEEVNQLLARLGKTLNFQTRFIADAAHQLKTPVAGIKGQIELALRENDKTKLQQSVAQLYLSADRLSRLVGQLLSLARNEPGAVTALNFQPLDLNALALETTMEWVPEALRRNVDLGFESADTAVMIDGDAHRLRELINNLIDNAVRYSQEGGRATVTVANLEAPALSVSDDGPNIPKEERTRIFERFHRLLGTHTDGSGLGLAIVREIAALHDAQITLEEDLDGIGNTFTVIFPKARHAA